MKVPYKNGEDLAVSGQLRVDEACLGFERAWKEGQRPRIEDYLEAIPELERVPLLRDLLALELAYRKRASETAVVEEYRRRFPERLNVVNAVFATESLAVHRRDEACPIQLGRYRVTAKIGAGSFGVVYKASPLKVIYTYALVFVKLCSHWSYGKLHGGRPGWFLERSSSVLWNKARCV